MLTKLDGDARGGAALSVRQVTGQPIMFASNGEGLTEFDVFHPDRMASRILGMGDVLTLIETAQKQFDEDEAEAMAAKLASGDGFTLEDFLEQLQAIRKMGPIGNLLGMLPGMGQMKDALAQVDDKDLDRTAAIIRSMTPTERDDPKIINGSRRLRIAKGSGVAGGRRQLPRRPVLRGPQDDVEDGGRHAGDARYAGHGRGPQERPAAEEGQEQAAGPQAAAALGEPSRRRRAACPPAVPEARPACPAASPRCRPARPCRTSRS